jgi:DNA mismatch endonuclease (patch repair protein)
MDVHSPEQRSYNMSRIKGKNTKPELLVRKWLWSRGYRYRLHRKDLPGKPDIVFPRQRKAVFVHGCFWHKHDCRYFKWPRTNREFWKKKINENVRRDQKNYQDLIADDWNYFIVWECELKEDIAGLWDRVAEFLEN